MQGSCEALCFTLQARARCHRRQSAGRVAAASSSARVDGRPDDMMRGVAQAAVWQGGEKSLKSQILQDCWTAREVLTDWRRTN